MAELKTAVELRDHLDRINEQGISDTAAVLIRGTLWLAYCTDPDGEWYFESGDPHRPFLAVVLDSITWALAEGSTR